MSLRKKHRNLIRILNKFYDRSSHSTSFNRTRGLSPWTFAKLKVMPEMKPGAKSFFIYIALLAIGSLAIPQLAGAADDEPVCVTQAKVKLRRGPGANYPVSWIVSQNMPLLKIGQQKSWYQVRDLDGAKHWINASAVSRRITCAVIKSRTAKLRTGPGKEFPSADLAFVDRYTPFKKIDRDGEWVQIQDEYQGKYWVHEDNIWIPIVHTQMAF